ncbi:MAG: VOC family protein [Acidobacteria bacterium]|nr:VOC family protein [Acidobacteriota bacterium]
MPPKLGYAIVFVANMQRAVRFYRDTLGLKLRFDSPEWTEFVTGETTLALHLASPKNPAGKVEIGFEVADLHAFHKEMTGKDVKFPMPPTKQDFGGELAQFLDSEGTAVSVGGPMPKM